MYVCCEQPSDRLFDALVIHLLQKKRTLMSELTLRQEFILNYIRLRISFLVE